MSADCLLDTNVLVYAVSRSPEARIKRAKALALIAAGGFGVSGQVLQEFYVTVTRKISTPLVPTDALEWIEQLAAQPFVPIDHTLVIRGIEFANRYKISYWDAAIVAAAEALGARTLYSEDLSHGQVYGSVTVRNPFLDAT